MIVIRRNTASPSQSIPPICDDRLGVSTNLVYIGEDSSQVVFVSWKLSHEANMIDWIGLFDFDDDDPLHYLDHKGRGVVGPQEGTVAWSVMRANLPPTLKSIQFGKIRSPEAVEHMFYNKVDDTIPFCSATSERLCPLRSDKITVLTRLCRYVDGLTGVVLARSPPIRITSKARLLIQEVSYHFFERTEDSRRLRLATAGKSKTITLPCDKQAVAVNSRFPYAAASSLDIAIGSTNCVIPLVEIEHLTGDLNIAVQSDQRHSFTAVISVCIEPMDTEGSARLRSRSKRTEDLDIRVSGVSASSSGSSMSQASSSSGSSTHLNVVPPLPAGWEACTDRRGRTFYIDHMSKKTTWQRPSATEIKDNEQIKRYSMNRRTVGMSPPTTPTYGPALFLQRPDFVSMLHENEAALAAYNASPIVKHIVHRIRKCGEPTEKYENNRDFVAFVNLFADDTQPLPMNWQASGRNPTVFIDHAARRTTLIDPRLPAPAIDRKRGRSAPPTRRQNLDKNGNLLDLASRTAEIALLVEERLPELAPKIRKKLRLIERLGAVALARLANDVDLITAISILDSDDQVVSSELEEKLNHFYASLHRSGYGKGPQKIKFRFSRSNLLNDAFEQILAADPVALRRARLSIAFDDEEGLDYGGPSRELFYLLSRELFHPYYGLFEYSAPDQYTVQISPHSHLVQQELQWMELAGRVLGLALLHRCLIDTFFTRTFYKMLLEQPVTVLDLQEVDPEFYRSMMWIRENPVDPSLGMTFVVSEEENGQVVEKELLPNGAELEVADQNKEEFISLMVKWRVERGIQRQSRALLRGLHQGGYYDEHVVIEWFWDRVAQMSNADRLKLLQFVTGTSSIPFEGFAMLRGSNGPKRFTIEKWGEESALPRRIVMPGSTSGGKERIQNPCGFAAAENSLQTPEHQG
ncbi:hypothetical protein Y032_0462g1901 [Ancylostoma ceylanicum]|uniref:HECT-type E3 ubiquitin transferase n=1 Tax=Ancylostoma ceylanicum TaxID=53326 RepID=A0A016WXU3_9BILA|nr:hypothetical protein Y032_0462g1901 [Ancylostoma ceylanicum]